MPDLIDIVLPTFIVIFIGYLIGKLTRINVAIVSDINLYIGLPALVFISLLKKEIVLIEAAKIWASSTIIMIGCLIVAWLVFRMLKRKHSGLYVPIAFMNTVNIPFPVVYLAYGAEGLAAATLFHIPSLLLLFTIGIYIMAGRRGKGNIREAAKQPAIYVAILALLLNFLDVEVPKLAMRTFDLVAMMTIPLVLLVLGYNLSKVKMTSVPTTLLASILRMGVGLGIGFLIVEALGIEGVFRSVTILVAAMPAAATTSMLAAKYENEAELVSSVVFLTTLASLVVVPYLLHVLG